MKHLSIKAMALSTFLACSLVTTALATNIPGLNVIEGSIVIDKNQSNGSTALAPEGVLDGVEHTQTKGSIHITLADVKDKCFEGVQFSLAKVADVENGRYASLDIANKYGIDFNRIKTANELELVSTRLAEHVKADIIKHTNVIGQVEFSNLDVGVYLVWASDLADYEQIIPFVVAVPSFDQGNQVMMMDVEVIPKHEPLPQPEDPSYALDTGIDQHSTSYFIASASTMCLAALTFVKAKKSE